MLRGAHSKQNLSDDQQLRQLFSAAFLSTRLIRHTVGHMACGNVGRGGFAMLLLVIKKHIGTVGAEKLTLRSAPKEKGFVDANFPIP